MLMRSFYICLSLFLLVACGEKKNQTEEAPLVIITSPDNPPFEFKDTASGGDQVIGFDMDVVHKLGEYLGRPIKIVEADFSALIPSLQSGRADMSISGFFPTEERRKSVDFSDPYYSYKLALLVPESSTLTSEKELNDKKLGVQLGSSHEAMGRKWVETTPGLSLVSLNKIGDLVQELKNGRIQSILIEDTTARNIAATTPGLKVVVLNVPGEALAIAFPKGSSLVTAVNEALKKMKGDIQEIESKWIRE
ncbi:MAG: amino acid ABC transporter substrate-binding protein [Proteobacteria bacterium]|nr:amino acid ABC transporter substrate-binding protein [Pseudomonadota bacterium]